MLITEDGRKVPVLLSVIAIKAYKLVKNLSDRIMPKDRLYSEIFLLIKRTFFSNCVDFPEENLLL